METVPEGVNLTPTLTQDFVMFSLLGGMFNAR